VFARAVARQAVISSAVPSLLLVSRGLLKRLGVREPMDSALVRFLEVAHLTDV
jgi:hypothetical protein